MSAPKPSPTHHRLRRSLSSDRGDAAVAGRAGDDFRGVTRTAGRSKHAPDDTRDALVISDEEGRVVELNRVFERLFGLTRADARGNRGGDLIIAPRFRAASRARRREALTDGAASQAHHTREFSGMHSDGGEFP